MKIFKYIIPVYERKYGLSLPEGSTIISCQNQNDQIVIWVLFDGSAHGRNKTYKFSLIYTGNDFESEPMGLHIGTVQIRECVHHLFLDEII